MHLISLEDKCVANIDDMYIQMFLKISYKKGDNGESKWSLDKNLIVRLCSCGRKNKEMLFNNLRITCKECLLAEQLFKK